MVQESAATRGHTASVCIGPVMISCFFGFEIVFEKLKKSGDLILYNTKGRIRHNIVRGGHVAKGRLVYSRILWPCSFDKFTNT